MRYKKIEIDRRGIDNKNLKKIDLEISLKIYRKGLRRIDEGRRISKK